MALVVGWAPVGTLREPLPTRLRVYSNKSDRSRHRRRRRGGHGEGSGMSAGRTDRPWPAPSRPGVMAMQWHDLLFMHWPLPLAVLRPLILRGLALDTFDGCAWIGVVPFTMAGGPCPVPAAAAGDLDVPGTQRADVCDDGGEGRRLLLQPRCREPSRGTRGAPRFPLTLLRRGHVRVAERPNRRLCEYTDAPWGATGRLRRALPADWPREPKHGRVNRRVVDRALLSL